KSVGVSRQTVSDNPSVAGVVQRICSRINNAIAIEVHNFDVARLQHTKFGSRRLHTTDVDLILIHDRSPSLCFFGRAEESIIRITPDFTPTFTHVMRTEMPVGIIELGDVCDVIGENTADVIREWFSGQLKLIIPPDGHVDPFCPKIRRIYTRFPGAKHAW